MAVVKFTIIMPLLKATISNRQWAIKTLTLFSQGFYLIQIGSWYFLIAIY